jgi:hypothetical protein
MAFVVQKPTTHKLTNPSGSVDTQYTFRIQTDQSCSTEATEGQQLPPADLLKRALTGSTLLPALIDEFVRASKSYFAKQNTAEGLLKVLKHTIVTDTPSGADDSNSNYVFSPLEISILRGSFYLQWKLAKEPLLITIPEFDGQDATVNSVVHGSDLQVADVEALPSAGSEEVLHLTTSRHIHDKRRVKEAHLRAKLAQYKAERTYTEYVEKYGTMTSDSEESETDSESENSDFE